MPLAEKCLIVKLKHSEPSNIIMFSSVSMSFGKLHIATLLPSFAMRAISADSSRKREDSLRKKPSNS